MYFRSKPGVSAYLGIILFGTVVCVMVVWQLLREHRLDTLGVELAATVLAHEALPGRNDYLTYRYDLDGRRYEARDLVSDRVAKKIVVGDRVLVRLLPDRPDDPLLENRGAASPWLGLAIGVVCIGGGIFGLSQLPRRR